MLKGLLSAETVARELPEDARVYMIFAKDTDSTIILPDTISQQGVAFAFMKQEDAEHFARLLQSEAPTFKDTEFDIFSVVLTEVINRAVEEQQMIGVVPPNSAREFFKESEDLFTEYYR